VDRTTILPCRSGQSGDPDFDDIESELYCSSREASVGYSPSVNLDFIEVAERVRRASRTVSQSRHLLGRR
jgi:hypothetical protein